MLKLILTLLPDLIGLVKFIVNFYRKQPQDIIVEHRKVFKEVRKAKSEQEKRRAARDLSRIISRM